MAGLDTHFDVVVVGSGFGGSVTAYRLAEAGLRVCVLERGKPYPPGSFPRSPREMKDNFWDPSDGRHGLFNAWSFRGLEALVSSGLGGGSLIYANVLLRKDEKWFVQRDPQGQGYEEWPITRADLDPHYDAVERMLSPQRFPLGAAGFAIPKTRAMQEAAQRLGLDWQLPNLAITFANAGSSPAVGEHIPDGAYPNLHGQTRVTCRLTGECDLGCNYGSKNTLDHNYLSAAKHHGADIRARCEVRSFAPGAGGGYAVTYVEHRGENEGKRTKTDQLPGITLTADRLVLSAGSLGSSYLLLRNHSAFAGISPALGTRFCGNGDLLGFMLRSRTRDAKRGPRVLDGSRGPVITSAIRVPDELDTGGDGNGGGPGYYVEDAGFPGFVDWMIEGTQVPGTANRLARFALRRLWAMVTRSPKSDLSRELAALVGNGRLSSGSLPLLGMGRDVPDGRMSLRKGYLAVDWTIDTSKDYFDRVADTMRAISAELGASFHHNPLWRLRRVITVHPLGGCPMGRHHGEGVVDTYGEVFGYPGLHVADGSVMPGPVGANPALTIAAFADRMADAILEGRTAAASTTASTTASTPASTPASTSPPAQEPASKPPTAIEFTEEMKGYVTFGESDFQRGFDQGRRDDTFLMFHLTIETDDVERFVADPAHVADARGWVECDALGGRLPVERGIFNLFVDAGELGRTNMLYRLLFADGAGHPLTFVGFKDVKDDRGLDLWRDTTTLFTRVLRGHVEPGDDEGADLVASGIITIHLLDFLQQLTTFRAHGPSASARAEGLGAFGRLFLGKLWDTYAGPVLDAAGAR